MSQIPGSFTPPPIPLPTPALMPNTELAADIERECQIDFESAKRVADYIEAGRDWMGYDMWRQAGIEHEWFWD